MRFFNRRNQLPQMDKDAEAKASLFARLTFRWINPLILLGCKAPLQHPDLPDILPADTASQTASVFNQAYATIAQNDYYQQQTSPKTTPPTPFSFFHRLSLRLPLSITRTTRALLPVVGRLYLKAALWIPIWFSCAIAQVFALRAIVDRITVSATPSQTRADLLANRWVYIPVAIAMALCAVGMSISQHALFFRSMRAGLRAKAALSAQIYDKMLRLHPTSYSSKGEGFLANLLLNDTQRVSDTYTYFHFLWAGIVEMFILSALLWTILGVSAVFGILILLMLVPAQVFFSVSISRARKRTYVHSDLRVQKMTELLSGIRVVKLSAWETHFSDLVTALRAAEVTHLKFAAIIRALNIALYYAAPVLVSLASFTAYTLIFGKPLTPSVVFGSVGFFSVMDRVLTMMPGGFVAVSEGRVALKRLDVFFDMMELPEEDERRLDVWDMLSKEKEGGESRNVEKDEAALQSDNEDMSASAETGDMLRLELQGAQFTYANADESENQQNVATILSNLSISVHDGELLAVVGPVASGKSSLLLGILGEMICLSGKVHRFGTVAYCAQQPWIINGTVRQNITLFGDTDGADDEKWYEQVVEKCCLVQDLDTLPAGDQTEIGERGVNLSGGQKARLALARAIYANADIYLFDDPLSALDSEVSEKLLKGVFGPSGLLASKAQIMVTHQLHVLPLSSTVMVLGGGGAVHTGTYQQLRAEGVEFSGFSGMEDDLDEKPSSAVLPVDEIEQNDRVASTRTVEVGEPSDLVRAASMEIPKEGSEAEKHSTVNLDSNEEKQTELIQPGIFAGQTSPNENSIPDKGRLVAEEDRRVGQVSASVYKSYIKAGGGYLAMIFCLVLFACTQAVRQGADAWLGIWSTVAAEVKVEDGGELTNALFAENRRHALIFLILAGGTALLALITAAFFANQVLTASQRLHDQLLDRILHATMTFFDANPIGRILNRFSKDIDQMDVLLPITEMDFLQSAFIAIGALATIAVILPWFLAPLAFVILMFIVIQKMYKNSSRELKRLDGVSRSPLYAQYVETMAGLATVRAFRSEASFSALFKLRIDNNNQAYHIFNASGRWLGFRLDALSAVVVFFTALVVIILSPSLDPGLAGVALTQSILLTGMVQWGVRQAAETENLFTSVERVSNMATMTPVEKPFYVEETKPPTDWPNEAVVSFDDVVLKYRPELEPALGNISFTTNSNERVGIVGRTGSGKSSLFVSLFRIVELTAGQIRIDGRDLSQMGLHDLRSRMAIVPQEPVLFNSTIRSNLDPQGLHEDASLWDALHRVHMSDAIRKIEWANGEGQGLDMVVQEKGSNFSTGERQLLSLARAILSGVRIVVLDEASASLDNHTDILIQKTVREQLKDRTVLTIAHRLATVADSDRVLVLDAGEVVEFDTPAKLIEKEGYFAKLVEETGKVESSILKAIIAEGNEKNDA